MKPRILVTADISHLPQIQAALEQEADVTCRYPQNKEELVGLISDVDGVITNLQQCIDKDVVDAAAKLRVIATPSTGTDHIDIDYATQKGIEVQSLKTDYDVLKGITSTAEHAFLLMLTCLRKLPFAFESVRQGEWSKDGFVGREAQGRTIGIIGYGRLGEILSRFALGFDMQVIAADPNRTITDPWVKQVELDELLSEVEIISIHVHLAPETRNMIGAREFDLMRDGVYLINTSRGGLIDEDAFLQALVSGKIACAGVDVLASELAGSIGNHPLVEHARTHENLVITPHIGGRCTDSQAKAYGHTVHKLLSTLRCSG